MSINVFISSAYYDFDDYDNSVKNFIENKFYSNIASNFTIESDIFLRDNSSEQNDSIFQLQPSSSLNNFISVEDVVKNFRRENPTGEVFRNC